MNIKGLLKTSYDFQKGKHQRYIFNVILLMLSFAIIAIISYLYLLISGFRARAQKGIAVNLNQVYYYDYDEVYSDTSREVLKLLSQEKSVIAMGNISSGVANTSSCLSFLRTIQNGHQKFINAEDYSEYNTIETWVINNSIWPMLSINIKEGKVPSSDMFYDPTVILLYLDERYKSITQIGDKYYEKVPHNDQIVYTYIVSGFFASDSTIVDKQIYDNYDYIKSGSYSLDYGIIEVMDTINRSGFIVLKDSADIKSIKSCSTVKNNFDKFSFYSINGAVNLAEENSKKLIVMVSDIAVILGFSIIIYLLCSQITYIFEETRELGVWLCNGLTRKDIVKILFLQNFMMIFISLLLSYLLSYKIIMHLFGINVEASHLTRSILPTVYCIETTIGIFLSIFASIIPAIIFYNISSVSMYKEN